MAETTLDHLSLKDYRRVSDLRDIYFRAMPEVDIERSELVTRFSLANGLLREEEGVSILDKAKMYRYVLENRAAKVHHDVAYERPGVGKKPKSFKIKDDNFFAGSTTSKFKGVPIYPEFAIALLLWPELWTMSTRESNPFQLSESDAKKLNYKIFPHWMKKNVMEITRNRLYKKNFEENDVKKSAPALQLFNRLVFFIPSKAATISHTIPCLSRAIDEGLSAIIEDARKRETEASEPSKKEFYQAIGEAMKGVIGYSNNLAVEAERLAKKEKKSELKEELLEIARINRRVPEHPAQTFREGLTTVWMCWVAIHTENRNFAISTGRMDQYLNRLYEKDIADGTMTEKDAVELLCHLWLKMGDHVPTVPDASERLFGGTGSNQAITIGGVDADGKSAVNKLTYVILKSIELMKLRDPNLNARYHPDVNSEDEGYLEELCKVNISTGATPAIHNDKAVIEALTSKGKAQEPPGEDLEQARDYGIIGCVEPGSCGRSYGHSAAILLNLISVLELALFNGKHRHTGKEMLISEETGDVRNFQNFDDFKKAFEKQVRWMVDLTTDLNNTFGEVYQDLQPTPILSALFEGPMEKGKCLEQGGATLNSSGATIIGFADVADSLTAIEKVVFEEGAPFADVLDAITNDFKDHSILHKRLLEAPKYGNDDDMADKNAIWVAKLLDTVFHEKKNYRGGRYRVGYWTMTNHAGFGRLMGATPNGRRAKENFTSGITPVSGVTPSLPAALNSVAKLPAKYLSSGVALNLKYTPEENMLEDFVCSVKGYFDDSNGTRDGGMEIQFNVTNRETFEKVKNNPEAEEAKELLVRVSGYTAYFKDLNEQMQKEIIDRTEYSLATRKMIPHKLLPLP